MFTFVLVVTCEWENRQETVSKPSANRQQTVHETVTSFGSVPYGVFGFGFDFCALCCANSCGLASIVCFFCLVFFFSCRKGLANCALPMPRSLLVEPSSGGDGDGDGDGSGSLGNAASSSTSGVGDAAAAPAARQPRKSPWGSAASGGGGGGGGRGGDGLLEERAAEEAAAAAVEDTRTGMEMLSDHVGGDGDGDGVGVSSVNVPGVRRLCRTCPFCSKYRGPVEGLKLGASIQYNPGFCMRCCLFFFGGGVGAVCEPFPRRSLAGLHVVLILCSTAHRGGVPICGIVVLGSTCVLSDESRFLVPGTASQVSCFSFKALFFYLEVIPTPAPRAAHARDCPPSTLLHTLLNCPFLGG